MGASVGLDAVVLIVKDFRAQRPFYADVLSLPLTGDYGDGVFFGCRSQRLALFGGSHHQRPPGGWKGRVGA